jgi:hypothetical protein
VFTVNRPTLSIFTQNSDNHFCCLISSNVLFIFPYTCISPSDIITISIKELTLILKIISQCDVIYMYIMSLPIKTLTSVFKISNNIITNIPTRSIILAAILVIMSVSTLKIALILYTFIDLKKKIFVLMLFNTRLHC